MKTTLFHDRITIDLPENYSVWDQDLPPLPGVTRSPGNDNLELDQKSGVFSDTPDESSSSVFYRSGRCPETFLHCLETGKEWGKAELSERLNSYHILFTRSLPLFKDYDLAFRPLKDDMGSALGQMRYSFASPDKEWYGVLLVFPIGVASQKEALINMVCPIPDSRNAMFEFASIADSLTLTSASPEASPSHQSNP